METIVNLLLNLSPQLAKGPVTFEIQTRTQNGGNAWEEVEVFNQKDIIEVASMMQEYADRGVLVEWNVL